MLIYLKNFHGAEEIQVIAYTNGTTKEPLTFTNTKGEPIVVPFL